MSEAEPFNCINIGALLALPDNIFCPSAPDCVNIYLVNQSLLKLIVRPPHLPSHHWVCYLGDSHANNERSSVFISLHLYLSRPHPTWYMGDISIYLKKRFCRVNFASPHWPPWRWREGEKLTTHLQDNLASESLSPFSPRKALNTHQNDLTQLAFLSHCSNIYLSFVHLVVIVRKYL